jgi:predicted PurR-regulated permease PerM
MAKQREFSPLFILVAIIAVVTALALAKEILLPIALAILLSFLLTPVANRLERWHVPRVLSVVLVVAMAFAPLGLVGWIVTKQLGALQDALPVYREAIVRNVTQKIRAVQPSSKTLDTVSETIEDVSKKLTDEEADREADEADESTEGLNSKPAERRAQSNTPNEFDSSADVNNGPTVAAAGGDLESASSQQISIEEQSSGDKGAKAEDDAVPVTVVNGESQLRQIGDWLLRSAAGTAAVAGLVVVLVFFLLLDRESQRNRMIQLFGRSRLHTTTEAFHEAAQRVGRYLRMLFLINTSY